MIRLACHCGPVPKSLCIRSAAIQPRSKDFCSCKHARGSLLQGGIEWFGCAIALLQVKDLAPADVREGEKKIPILTTGEGIGERVVLEEADSAING